MCPAGLNRSVTDRTLVDTYPQYAWQRLGRALQRRRGQLGYGFRQRGRFVADTGSRLSSKTIARLENGDRSAYPEATLALAEVMYRWAPGSAERVLRGGEPFELPIREPQPPEPARGETLTGLTAEEKHLAAEWIEQRRQERNPERVADGA
jgi:hypothetical protein